MKKEINQNSSTLSEAISNLLKTGKNTGFKGTLLHIEQNKVVIALERVNKKERLAQELIDNL